MTYPGPRTFPGPNTYPNFYTKTNWPNVSVQVEFVSGTWTPLVNRVRKITANRGRQHELATAQAGTLNLTIDDSDGNLDPTNTAGAYYPNVKINRRVRVQVSTSSVTKTIFTGFIERYPQRWEYAGTYQYTDLVAVDALGPLSKTQLDPIAYETINSYNPVSWWVLDDAVGSAVAGSRIGGKPLTQLATRANGSTATGPFFAFGATQGAPGSPPVGMEGTSGAGFTPGPGALTTSPADMTVLRSPANTPPLPTTGGWTVYCSAESTAPSMASVPAPNGCRVLVLNAPDGSSFIALGVTGTDNATAFATDATGTAVGGSTTTSTILASSLPVRGPWNNGLAHYYAVSLSADHKTYYFTNSVNGVLKAYTKNDGTAWDFSTLTSFSVGGEYRPNNNGNFAYNAWTGVVNNVAIFNSEIISTGVLTTITNSEMLGFSGDDTALRFRRLMALSNYPITTGSAAGNSSVQAPKIKGKTLAAAITDVANDEFGTLYVNGDGLITFTNRQYRINPAPTITLTDAGIDGAGVYRYTNLTTDFDDQHLLNDVRVSRNNGVNARSMDAQSILDNGTYGTSITTNITDDQQAIDRASYTAGRYAYPLPRIASIQLSPGTDFNLWALVTSLDLNQAVTVVRTPLLGHSFTRVCWVEQISYSVDSNSGNFTITMQLSPADVNTYFVLDNPVLGKLDSGNKLSY